MREGNGPDKLDADDMAIQDMILSACSTDAVIKRCMQAAETEDLVLELLTRKKLRKLGAERVFSDDMALDPGYMGAVEHLLAQTIAQGLREKEILTFANRPTPGIAGKTIRMADITILLTSNQVEDIALAEKAQAESD